MADPFQQLRQELFVLYREQRYEEALELVRSKLDDFPVERPRMTFWLACLQCRTGHPDDGLRTLSAFVAQGGWMSPSHLRNESDLEPLRGDPELERIIAACDARLEAARGRVEPKLLLEMPSPFPEAPPPLLVALHMMGGTAEESLYNWRHVVDRGVALAAPRGSELLGPGAYAWNERTAEELKGHLESIEEEMPFDRDRLILAGASQGARMATLLAIDGSVPACGFIAVVGAPQPERLEPHLERAKTSGLRGIFITGEHDTAREGIEATYRYLHQAGVPVTLAVVPDLGHDYPPHFADHIGDALEFLGVD